MKTVWIMVLLYELTSNGQLVGPGLAVMDKTTVFRAVPVSVHTSQEDCDKAKATKETQRSLMPGVNAVPALKCVDLQLVDNVVPKLLQQ